MSITSPLPRYLRLIRFAAGFMQVGAAGILFIAIVKIGALILTDSSLGGEPHLAVMLRPELTPADLGVVPSPTQPTVNLGFAEATLALPADSRWIHVFATLQLLAMGIVWFVGARVIRKVADEATTTSPFNPQNHQRLQHLAWLALGYWLWRGVALTVAHSIAQSQLGFEHTAPLPIMTLSILMAPELWLGIAILAAAEIFRQGIDLREENDLTV